MTKPADDPGVFQTVFGEILTLLIALEFNHTLQHVVKRKQSIIQTKVVLLIALLAVARSSSFSTCVTWTRASCSRWPQSRWRWVSPTG